MDERCYFCRRLIREHELGTLMVSSIFYTQWVPACPECRRADARSRLLFRLAVLSVLVGLLVFIYLARNYPFGF